MTLEFRCAPHRLVLFACLILLACAGCSEDAQENQDPADISEDAAVDTSLDVDADVDIEDDTSMCGDGICGADEDETSCPADCDPSPVVEYDPLAGEITVFPDDFYTVADGDTPTGLRVDISEENAPYILDIPEGFRKVFYDLAQLDGFGTTAGGFFTFDHPIDRAALPDSFDTAAPDSPLFIAYEDDAGELVRVPVDWLVRGFDDTLVMRPLAPLPPATRAVMGVTTDLMGRDGGNAHPNDVLASLLTGEATGDLARLNPRYTTAVQQMIDAGIVNGVDEIGAMTVFTTQSIVEPVLGIRDDIRNRDLSITELQGCEDKALYRECSFTFEAANYRDENRRIIYETDNSPQEIYELTAVVYLPLEPGQYGGPPYRTILFGHGLGGSRTQASQLADYAAPMGIATIAIDAPDHGLHPINTSNDSLDTVLAFFGVNLDGADISVDSVVLRDSWQQATFDKLALLEVLGDGIDLDSDNMLDITTDDLSYIGASLGSIMGPQFLALTDEVGAAVLIIGGSRVTDVIQLGDAFSVLIDAVKPPELGEDDVARFFVLLQTSIERGDSGNWARYVVTDRLNDAPPVQVLDANVLDDGVVPNVTNWVLARALGVPQVPPVLVDVGTIPLTATPPIAGNLPGGGTAGFMQFDWLPDSGSETGWKRATHGNIGASEVGAEAWLHFVGTYLESGTAEIIDPYETLGLTPPR